MTPPLSEPSANLRRAAIILGALGEELASEVCSLLPASQVVALGEELYRLQQVPTVEYFGVDSDANSLGVSWRIVYRFGAALGEYRAGVKSKGAAS